LSKAVGVIVALILKCLQYLVRSWLWRICWSNPP